MNPITTANKNLILGGQKQLVNIAYTLADGVTTGTLTEADVMENTLTIDRATSYGGTMFIGSSTAAQLDFVLADYNGTYASTDFHGATLKLNLCLMISGTRTAVCELGQYTVLTAKRDIKQIKITALDILAKCDEISDRAGDSGYSLTLATILQNVGNRVFGSTSAIDYSAVNSLCTSPTMANFQYPSGTDVTYHNLIAWCAALTGTIARAHGNSNTIQLVRNGASGESITKAKRYTGRCEEADVALTGISAIDASGVEYNAGTAGYELNISSNGIFEQAYNQSDNTSYKQTLINNLWSNMGALTTRPFRATTLPMPWLECGDTVSYVDESGVSHSAILTHIRFALNGKMQMECDVPSAQEEKISAALPSSIKRSSITTEMLRINAIKSINYVDAVGDYSAAGTWFDLARGLIKSKNFAIDRNGNAYFKGTVNAGNGSQIGNATIGTGDITTDGTGFMLIGNNSAYNIWVFPNLIEVFGDDSVFLASYETNEQTGYEDVHVKMTNRGGDDNAQVGFEMTQGVGKLTGTWTLNGQPIVGVLNANGVNF